MSSCRVLLSTFSFLEGNFSLSLILMTKTMCLSLWILQILWMLWMCSFGILGVQLYWPLDFSGSVNPCLISTDPCSSIALNFLNFRENSHCLIQCLKVMLYFQNLRAQYLPWVSQFFILTNFSKSFLRKLNICFFLWLNFHKSVWMLESSNWASNFCLLNGVPGLMRKSHWHVYTIFCRVSVIILLEFS